MTDSAYPLFCPVAMASEMLQPRWTLLVLCEMWSGSTRFNEIQRGVPGMSPTLLAKRLREMERHRLVRRTCPDAAGIRHYITTPMADELEPVVRQLGEWSHRNISPAVSLQDLDPNFIMWNIRRKINRSQLPLPKCVIQFTMREDGKSPACYWLVVRPGYEPDLCFVDKGFSVDLFIVSDLRAFTSAWLGYSSFREEIAAERIGLVGNEPLARSLTKWLIKSSFAPSADDDVPSCALTHAG